jgi:hypothetical protein
MAKQEALSLDNIELIKRIVRNECKELAEAVDETSLGNLKLIGTVTDRNSYNIMKLQAQITALKDSLCGKGVVSRGNLTAREEAALAKIENQVKAMAEKGQPAGAMPS